jgi:hypothetical protein
LFELMSETMAGGQARWIAENLSAAELESLRSLRGPFSLFKRGEPLALMPFRFIR